MCVYYVGTSKPRLHLTQPTIRYLVFGLWSSPFISFYSFYSFQSQLVSQLPSSISPSVLATRGYTPSQHTHVSILNPQFHPSPLQREKNLIVPNRHPPLSIAFKNTNANPSNTSFLTPKPYIHNFLDITTQTKHGIVLKLLAHVLFFSLTLKRDSPSQIVNKVYTTSLYSVQAKLCKGQTNEYNWTPMVK